VRAEFTTTLAHPDVPNGNYTLVMRVVDPLNNGRPLRFANRAQDATLAGWLTLGGFSNSPAAGSQRDGASRLAGSASILFIGR
jgi:hypothetical protein